MGGAVHLSPESARLSPEFARAPSRTASHALDIGVDRRVLDKRPAAQFQRIELRSVAAIDQTERLAEHPAALREVTFENREETL